MIKRLKFIAFVSALLAIIIAAFSGWTLFQFPGMEAGPKVTLDMYNSLLGAQKALTLILLPPISAWLLYVSVALWIHARKPDH